MAYDEDLAAASVTAFRSRPICRNGRCSAAGILDQRPYCGGGHGQGGLLLRVEPAQT